MAQPAPPKLILQITVDQLRGDLPERFLDQMGAGGFRYLLEQGVVFKDAHHAHSNTETIVGHATLATGAHPAAHGMVANVWSSSPEREISALNGGTRSGTRTKGWHLYTPPCSTPPQ